MSEIPSLNKLEKRDLVIKLHHKEGKTYREICQIARVSPNNIKLILKRYKQNLENSKRRKENNQAPTTKKLSLSSQAFKLFRDNKQPTEVAIELDIPYKQVSKFWWQFLKLEKKFDCYEFYEIWQYDLPLLLSISSFMKRNDVSGTDILNILRTTNDVINLNQKSYNLKTEIKDLEQKRMYLMYTPSSSYSLQPLPPNKSNYNYYNYY